MNGITITLNGEQRSVGVAMTVLGLLKEFGLDPSKVAIERNMEIVPRSQYAATLVLAGDRLEVVHFIGGGK